MSLKPDFLENVDPKSRLFPKSWRDFKIRELRHGNNRGIICPLCKTYFDSLIDIQQFEADHIYPYSSGGETTWDNCQVICRKCNRSKLNKHM